MTKARRILLWARSIAAIATIGLLTLHPRIGHAAPDGVLLSGTVRSASGEKMEGITVSAKVIGGTVTTSVFTDDHGKYHFPPMQDGKHWVWAQAVAFEAPRVDVNLQRGIQHQDFVMKPKKDYFSQLTGDQLAAALPDDTSAHRRMKDIFLRNCVGCHEANITLQNRFDEQGWDAVIWAMSRIGAAGGFGSAARAVPEFLHYKQELAAYLAEMRGPGRSPMQLKVPPRPSGDSTLPVIYAYDVPVDDGGGYILNNGSDWSLGPSMASGGGQGLHDAQVDFNGNLWVTHADSASVDRTITKVDGKTGEVTKFRYPRRTGPLASNSHGVTIAREDGTIWFTMLSEQKLGTIDPKTNTLEVFTPPAGQAGPFVSCDEDGRGNIWSSTLTGSILFDRKTKEFTNFTALTEAGLFAYGMAGDRDGNGWWTEINVDIIGHSDIETGATHEITVPPNTTTFLKPGDVTPDDFVWYGWEIPGWNPFPSRAPFGEQMPRRLAADHNGDDIWVPDNAAQSLLRINTHTLQLTFYDAPRPNLRPYMAVVDNSHNVWMNLLGSDEFAKFDPEDSQWTLYSWPNRGTSTRGFHVLDRGGVLQVSAAYFNASTVAKAVFRTRQDIEALENANE